MTPKEKAEELYDYYWVYFTREESVKSIFKHAKQCALIAVDEIINSLEVIPHKELKEVCLGWWQEVKQEIDNITN